MISRTRRILELRANVLVKIRDFFAKRQVLEVETPLLSPATVTDPYLHSFKIENTKQPLYLQTSPEYAMKRLLANGSACIYQLCKAFRKEEAGALHHPEFTMLEWYRIGFNYHDLMDEMDQLLQCVLESRPAKRTSYADLFLEYIKINPHTATLHEIQQAADQLAFYFPEGANEKDSDLWLQLLMSDYIEPHLGKDAPHFVYDYPVTQAALAKIRSDVPPVAERFEVYVKGIELANGFHELTDAKEQEARFLADLEKRKQLGYSKVPIDRSLLDALEQGLPDCSGVALGVDRLVMLAAGAESLSDLKV